MAITTVTVGTNSYVTLEEADNYLGDRLYTDAWFNSNDDSKAKALIMATNKIDQLPIAGEKADDEQTLEFPRTIYSTSKGWNKYTEEEVSQRVKYAQCEEAFELIETGTNQRAKLIQQGVSEYSIGDLSEKFNQNYVSKSLLSVASKEYLSRYLLKVGKVV